MKNKFLCFVIMSIVSLNGFGQDKPVYKQEAIELYNKGGEFLQNGQEDSAFVYYNKAIELDDSYYLPHINKATVYIERKEYKKAINELNEVVKKRPDLAEIWVGKGNLHDIIGQIEESELCYQKSIELFTERLSNNDEVNMQISNRLNRAVSYILLGDEEKGKSQIKQLRVEFPENSMLKNPWIDQILLTSPKQELLHLFFDY